MKFDLEKITIVSINTRDPENSIRAIERSSKYINFKNYILITDKPIKHNFIEAKIIKKFENMDQYSFFCIKELVNYINTDYCLMVQPDGFVTNPFMWTDDFLKYDYIGALWDKRISHLALNYASVYSNLNLDGLSKIPNIVGNGGFCLRSKKFLQESSKLEYNVITNEDMFLCAVSRKKLTENGIKFAPANIANRFSIESSLQEDERLINLCSYFGFHGKDDFKKPLLDLLYDYDNDVEFINNLKKYKKF
jgi:hypothetical protein